MVIKVSKVIKVFKCFKVSESSAKVFGSLPEKPAGTSEEMLLYKQ